MDTGTEEQIDYGDEEYGGAQKLQYQGSGAIPALADEEMIGEDDDYEDLYDGVNVGEGFLQFHQSEAQVPHSVGNDGVQTQTFNAPETRQDTSLYRTLGNSGPATGVILHNASLAVKEPELSPSNHISGALGPEKRIHDSSSRNMGFQAPALVAQNNPVNVPEIGKATNPVSRGPSGAGQGTAGNQMTANANAGMDHMMINDNVIRPQMDNGPTMLFVGELHWWTTDAEIESVLSHYGKVKELKFFDERASGKSKGYCQVEFYDAVAAASCKEGMNGHIFNGRACVVAFSSPQTLKQMGAAYASKNPQQPQPQPQGRRNVTDGDGRGGGMNYSAGDGGRGFARGGWGRGQGQNAAARGPGGLGPRGRGPMGPKNPPGNVGGMGGGAMGNFGQGLGGPGFGGPGGGMMHPQAMMGPGFDPSYMGRGGGYGGFSGPGFPGMMPPFPAGNPMGMGGVAPHVNPAFFGRGMAPNGMGMMGSSRMEGHPGGMWADPGMGGWAGEEHGQKTRESSYGGEDGASDYGYGDGNPEKGSKTNAAPREKERPERDWSGNSERRYRDEREQDYDRSDRERRYRDDKDGHRVHRQKERDVSYKDDWDRGQTSSRSRSRSRAMPEDDYRSRSRDVEYGKRRRAPSE